MDSLRRFRHGNEFRFSRGAAGQGEHERLFSGENSARARAYLFYIRSKAFVVGDWNLSAIVVNILYGSKTVFFAEHCALVAP